MQYSVRATVVIFLPFRHPTGFKEMYSVCLRLNQRKVVNVTAALFGKHWSKFNIFFILKTIKMLAIQFFILA